MSVAGQDRSRGLGAPAGQARDAVGRVAHQRQPVRDGRRLHAELLHHPGPVVGDLPPAVDLHDAGCVVHHLGKILVRGAHQYPTNARIDGSPDGCGPHRIVGLVLDHSEHREPGGLQRRLQQRKLGEQFRRRALPGLVAVEQVVAERLDHPVGGHPDVGGSVRQQPEHGTQHPTGGRHLHALGGDVGRHGEVVAEELVGAVHQVDVDADHGVSRYPRLLLDQLDQRSERSLRVDEGHGRTTRTGTGDHVDGPTTGCHDGLQGLGAVVDPVADVVDAFAALLQEPGDRRIGSGSGRELDVGLSDPQQGFVDAVPFDDLTVVDLGTEGRPVVGDGRLQVVDRDGNVVYLGQQHAGPPEARMVSFADWIHLVPWCGGTRLWTGLWISATRAMSGPLCAGGPFCDVRTTNRA